MQVEALTAPPHAPRLCTSPPQADFGFSVGPALLLWVLWLSPFSFPSHQTAPRRGGEEQPIAQDSLTAQKTLGNPCQGPLSVKPMSKTIISHGITGINSITRGYSCRQNKVMKSSVSSYIPWAVKALQHFPHKPCGSSSSPLGLLNFHFSHWTIVDHYEPGICGNAASHVCTSSR